MWPKEFEPRLVEWNNLRRDCASLDLSSCVLVINDWWFQCPWRPYHLHWDDRATWPDPWDLLADNVYCDLARALGIVYTLMLLEHDKTMTIQLADTDQGNLVLVDDGKYILNWCRGEVLNIHSTPITIKKIVDSNELKNKLG